jgi:hypothetical protein
LFGDEKGIRVDAVVRQQFRSDRDDLSVAHFNLVEHSQAKTCAT